MDYLIGQTVGRYRLERLLKEGKLGATYEGYEPTEDQAVIVRLMPPQVARRLAVQERFLQEAQALARLDHPGLVNVLDYGRERGALLYLVTEFIAEDTLDRWLSRLHEQGQWLHLAESLELVEQLCLIVAYLRQQGRYPPDIRPAQITLKAEPALRWPYRPLLTDLGWGSLLVEDESGPETIPVERLPYSSPEAVLGKAVDARSDVYTLGVVLYELVVGRLPFPIKTHPQAVRYHSTVAPPAPSSLRFEVPQMVDTVVMKTLAKNPAERFAHATELAETLAFVRKQVSTDAASSTLPEAAAWSNHPWPEHHRDDDRAAASNYSTGTTKTKFDAGLSQEAGRVERPAVFTEPTPLSVEPGHRVTLEITLLNQSSIVDHFETTIVGLPTDWVTISPVRVELLPGQQQKISLVCHPPRVSQSLAGNHTFTIRVASQKVPDQIEETIKILEILAFDQLESELYPQRIQAGKVGTMTLHNQGNSARTYHLKWQDPAGELAFEPLRARITVEPGQSETMKFQAKPYHRSWWGGPTTYPITVRIQSDEGTTQKHEGEIVSRGSVPIWVVPLFVLLCAGLTASGVFGYRTITLTRATETAVAMTATAEYGIRVANMTATAEQEATTVAQNRTETAEIEAASRATSQAATATTTWLEEDDDRDRIPNGEELALNTLPDKRDTDEDSLDDGDELDRGTDPLRPDSDGDGLKDGVEVAQGLNPLQTDSDNDGTPDASDEDPGRIPTPTNTATPTPTVPPEPPTSVTPPPPSVSNDSQFTAVTDDQDIISIDVWRSWDQRKTGRWTLSGQEVGLMISASSNLSGFENAYRSPGIFLGVSKQLATRYDNAADLLDALPVQDTYRQNCEYNGRSTVSTPKSYTGFIDGYRKCGSGLGQRSVLAIMPQDRSYIVVLDVQVFTEEEALVARHTRDSLAIIGQLPD